MDACRENGAHRGRLRFAHGGPQGSRTARLAAPAGAIAIGYSGGVDSAYLAAVAVAALGADRVLAIIGRSASYPESQWAAAREIARAIGSTVLEIDTDELNDPRYAANPTNRCYFCKTELWSRFVPIARERGIDVVADGTNADDLSDYRPGAQAAREHGVVSPLAMFGFTKAEIRDLSRARGLPTWRAAVVALPVVSHSVWHAGHGRTTQARRARRGGAPRARGRRATFAFGISVTWRASS